MPPLLALLAVILMLATASAAKAQPFAVVTAAQTPQQLGVATVIAPPGALCPELATQFARTTGPRGDLRDRCTELIVDANNPSLLGSVQAGLQQMAPQNTPALGLNSLGLSALQSRNILARLAALRLGVGGIGLTGVSLDDGEQTTPAAGLASAWPSASLAPTASAAPGDPSGRLGVFLNGIGAFGDKDTTSRELGFDFHSGGVVGGVDYRFTRNLIIGGAFSYTATRADLASSGGHLDSDDYAGSIYGTYYLSDGFYVDALASGGIDSYDSHRRINYSIPAVTGGTTVVDQTAKSKPDGSWYSFGATAGYDIHFGGGFTAGPLARLNYVNAHVDHYRESINNNAPGSGLALAVDGQDVESLTSSLGVQGTYAISAPFGVFVPLLRAEWQHEYLNGSRPLTATFVQDPNPSAAKTIRWTSDDPDRDYCVLGAGVSATFRRGIVAFFYYETVLALRNVTEHKFTAGLRKEF